jgi:hypothetical protein
MGSIAKNGRTHGKGQLTLGMLISKITACEKNETVAFDFGYMCPTRLDSWRGAYDELALNYVSYTNEDVEIKRDDFLVLLKSAIGKTFHGYKGGEFVMNEDTPIWVANDGEACDTAVVGVLDLGWKIIIQTSYMEY